MEVANTVALVVISLAMVGFGINQWTKVIKKFDELYTKRVRRRFDKYVSQLEELIEDAGDSSLEVWDDYGRTVQVGEQDYSDQVFADALYEMVGMYATVPRGVANPAKDAFLVYVITAAFIPHMMRVDEFIDKHFPRIDQGAYDEYDHSTENIGRYNKDSKTKLAELGFDLATVDEYVKQIVA